MTGPPGIALGTVQLGTAYGAVNKSGMPSEDESLRIIATAKQLGISVFDTARAYGVSEARLGLALSQGVLDGTAHIVTKIDAHSHEGIVDERVDASIEESLRQLRLSALPTLCMHYWYQRDAVWSRMLHWRDTGRVRELGTSTYHPSEVLAALRDPDVKHIQLPLSLLDWRWRARPGGDASANDDPGAELARALAARPDVRIHVRSVFLQGILLAEEAAWPSFARASGEASRVLAALDELVRRLQRVSRADLCLAYVRSLSWVSAVVVGAETVEQVRTNAALGGATPLTPEERAMVEAALPRVEARLLDPSQWQAEAEPLARENALPGARDWQLTRCKLDAPGAMRCTLVEG